MKKLISFFLVFAVFSFILNSHASLYTGRSEEPLNNYAADQIVIKLKADTYRLASAEQVANNLMMAEGTSAEALSAGEPGEAYLISLNGKLSVEDAIAQASKDPRVEYAEPNYYCYAADTTPNDPMFQEMWGLHNAGYFTGAQAGVDINATKAWDLTTGSNETVVAIIDTGVYMSHPDLAPNAWVNSREVAANGRDDDGNGYIDDINGYNFFSNNNQVYTDASSDKHGTHVAGTIGAAGNNGIGVTGVAWRVKLMALKFLGNAPSAVDNAVRAINYVIDQKRRGVNVRVINASWISSGDSRALRDAIVAAGNAGILFVCGAGNGGDDKIGDDIDGLQSMVVPAAWSDLSSLISVAAVDFQDRLADFSNYGRTMVSVAAPGVSILSTYPPADSSSNGGYAYMQGTSMATAHVSGIAALLATTEPGLTPAQIKQRIIATAHPVLSLVSKVVSAGRADAHSALTNPAPPVAGLVIGTVQVGKKSMTVEGTGFVSGSSTIEVNGIRLNTRYDSSSILANGSPGRLTAKLSKSQLKSTFPSGVRVNVTVFNPTSNRRSVPFIFIKN